MDEIVYSVLYKKEVLDGENHKYRFIPCYIIKGLYDEDNNIFLDEINKSRLLFSDPSIMKEEITYCVGDIYSKKDLYKKFNDANSLEDAEIRLFKDAESKMTVGTFNKKDKAINIKNISLDNFNEEDKKEILKDDENDKKINPLQMLESLEKEYNCKFVVLFPEQVEEISELSDDDMLDYVKEIIKQQKKVGINKEDLVSVENPLCINRDALVVAIEEKNYDFINSVLDQYCALIDQDGLEDNEYYEDETDLIDTEEMANFIDEKFSIIVSSNDISEIKSQLKEQLEYCKEKLSNISDLRDMGYEVSSAITYFNVQVQCIFDILKKSDIESMKKEYVGLYRVTRGNISKISKEFDNLNEYGLVPYEEQQKQYEEIFGKEKISETENAMKEATDKLDKLVGLQNVKDTFDEIFSTLLFEQKTKENLEFESSSKHMLFTGNPGTGKTTVASIVAPLFHKLGYTESDKVSYVAAQDLIGKYVGQTAPKTEEVIKKNKGGVIVLDEAYILAGPAQQFGNEALTVIIKEMEKNNTVFIFAGYKKEMEDFVKMNSGIESRVGTFVQFDDYNNEELLQMFKKNIEKTNKCEDQKYKLSITDEALEKVSEIIDKALTKEDFGNGRFVKKLFTTINREHAKNTKYEDSIERLYTITKEDISDNVLSKMFFDRKGLSDLSYKESHMGFNANVKKLSR